MHSSCLIHKSQNQGGFIVGPYYLKLSLSLNIIIYLLTVRRRFPMASKLQLYNASDISTLSRKQSDYFRDSVGLTDMSLFMGNPFFIHNSRQVRFDKNDMSVLRVGVKYIKTSSLIKIRSLSVCNRIGSTQRIHRGFQT